MKYVLLFGVLPVVIWSVTFAAGRYWHVALFAGLVWWAWERGRRR